MQKCVVRLTVFFEDPFWVGVYERVTDGKLEVCRTVFRSEPKEYEVYAFYLEHWHTLRFSPPVRADARQSIKTNPKRMQREIKKQLERPGVGTKAQQAMKLQQAEGKEARKNNTRLEREREKERQFELRREKKKQKRKGH